MSVNRIKPCYFLVIMAFFSQACHSNEAPADAAGEQESPLYQEAHRPQFHFSPPGQWMNDPNGMVYYDGEYHLFYQHYPDSNVWGPMHWGHAVSEDLVHWENLPIALYPDSLGYIFSGSAVVDENNTSGLGAGGQGPLVAIFTYHDPDRVEDGTDTHQTQAIAYSNDRGRTWTKYEGNPVVPNPGIRDFRDPKVFWHDQTGRWVMIFAALDRVRIYTSTNLIDWTFASEFGEDAGSHGGVWECPDLFELPVEGSNETRWVMLLSINPGGPNSGSATQYFIGDFDGQAFTLEAPQEGAWWIDYGRDDYAGVTWSDVPESDGRRIFIGWMSNWDYANVVPTYAWRSAMTLPRTLHLRRTSSGLRLASLPVEELQTLRGPSADLQAMPVEGSVILEDIGEISPSQMELTLEWSMPEGFAGKLGVELSNPEGESYRVGFDAAKGIYYSDRQEAGPNDFSDVFAAVHSGPRWEEGENLNMHLFFDTASAELFADGGSTVLTDIYFPTTPFQQVAIFAEGDEGVRLLQGKAYSLESIW